MTVRTVAFASPEYDATVELRREVLRRPLGLDFTPEQLAAESDDVHLALFEEGEVLACLILALDPPLLSGGEEQGVRCGLKMRQVAVGPARQGHGLGRRLVEASETLASERGFTTMVLHARESAIPFYLALGYAPEGPPFEEVGLPHRKMSKTLHTRFGRQNVERADAEGV